MKCEIVLGAVSPIWHDFAIQELSARFMKWAREVHPELFEYEKRYCDQTTNQLTVSRAKPKKYKKASMR